MKYEITRDEHNEAQLTITVEKDEVANAIGKAYLKIAKEVNIPGFRKGKAPRLVLEQHVGKQAFIDEAAEIMMPPAYAEAITTEGLEPVDRPRINIVSIGEDQDFIFEAKVTLRPEPKIGEYKGLPLSKIEIVVTDENVEDELKRLQERRAKIVTVDDAIQDQDVVQIGYAGTIDGVAFDGGTSDNYSLGIGSGTFIPGFEEQLIGHKAGEMVDVLVTFPEDYHAEEMQGKEAKFEVEIKEVRRNQLLPLDDTFAKDVSAFETLDELRADTRRRLEESAAQDAEDHLRNQAIEQLLAITEVEIPNVMIEDKIDSFIDEMNGRLQQQGLDIEKYLQYTGKEMAALREENREGAARSVKTELALMTIAEKEDLQAEDVDIDAEIAKVALMTNTEPQVIKERLIQSGQFEVLVYTLIIRKAISFLVENGKMMSADELAALAGKEDAEAAAEAEAAE